MGCEKEENKLWLLCFWGIALLRNSQENTQSGGADKLTTRNKATKWSRSEKTHRRKAIWWLQSPALQQNDPDSWDVDGREKLKEEGKIEPCIFYYFLFVSSWTHGPIFIDWSMTRPPSPSSGHFPNRHLRSFELQDSHFSYTEPLQFEGELSLTTFEGGEIWNQESDRRCTSVKMTQISFLVLPGESTWTWSLPFGEFSPTTFRQSPLVIAAFEQEKITPSTSFFEVQFLFTYIQFVRYSSFCLLFPSVLTEWDLDFGDVCEFPILCWGRFLLSYTSGFCRHSFLRDPFFLFHWM